MIKLRILSYCFLRISLPSSALLLENLFVIYIFKCVRYVIVITTAIYQDASNLDFEPRILWLQGWTTLNHVRTKINYKKHRNKYKTFMFYYRIINTVKNISFTNTTMNAVLFNYKFCIHILSYSYKLALVQWMISKFRNHFSRIIYS